MQTSKVKHAALRMVKASVNPAGAPQIVPRAAPATGDYHHRLEDFARRIHRTDDVGSIVSIIEEALREAGSARNEVPASVALAEITRAELEIEALKTELEQLRGMVHVDHLTGALNRCGFDQVYPREAARADRQAAPLGTALLDIDDFKSINDRHGHQAGDAALVHFAQVIKRSMRPSDVVVRFGGEEFLFLLPDSGTDDTARALSRLQQDLHRSPLVYGNCRLPITFSAGIAVRKTGETRDAVIARADRALYRAKSAGKNRAVTAD
ncbi:MAG: GGDEF domain-containing protein [Betaproteobacteria bacterium]|nr:GGDEF domain-containing protein [Betaproteobacteria bacterium]